MNPSNVKPARSWKKIWLAAGICLSGLCVLLGIAAYLLLEISPVPETSGYQVDLAEVRKLAGNDPQALPLALNAVLIADGAYPQVIVIAGGSFQNQRMAFPSFQVGYADSSIVIDAVHRQADHQKFFPGEPYRPEQFARMQAAMQQSRLILATHEHFDHIGGLAAAPDWNQIQDKILLTRTQLELAGPETGLTPQLKAGLTGLEYDRYHAIAPGVVLIRAAGHTPGSQMIYVRLKNQAEYLLTGDVVWNSLSLERLTGRSWLASLMLREDRARHGQQIRTLYNLARTEPIHLIISHDGEQIEGLIQSGLLGADFK